MNSFSKTLFQRFSKLLLFGAVLIVLTIISQIAVSGFQKGPDLAHATDPGYCENGSRFLGGDAGDDNNWRIDPSCDKSGSGGQGQGQGTTPTPPAPTQPPVVTPQPPIPTQPPAPQCTPNEVIGTQMDAEGCTHNIHHRADCSQYLGGAYNCPVQPTPPVYTPTPPVVTPPPAQCPYQVVGTTQACQGAYMCSFDTIAQNCSQHQSGAYNCVLSSQSQPQQVTCNDNRTYCDPTTGTYVQQTSGYYNGSQCIYQKINTGQSCVATPTPPVVTPTPVVCSVGQVKNDQGICVAQAQAQQCPNGLVAQVINSTIVCVNQQQAQNQQQNQVINNSNTNIAQGGNAYVNVTTEREVVRFATNSGPSFSCPSGTTATTQGSETVCMRHIVTQVAGVQSEVKELPKTGLPILAWGALAFIPAGFRMKRFKMGAKGVITPSYIWEEKKFKRN